MRCFRKLHGITYRDHISNEEVQNRIKEAIGPYDDLQVLTTVRHWKLKWKLSSRNQIVRAGKDHTAWNSTRRKEERQREEEMGGQYKGVDRITSEQYLEESGESWGMERVGCQDTCGTPTVYDKGIGEGEGELAKDLPFKN